LRQDSPRYPHASTGFPHTHVCGSRLYNQVGEPLLLMVSSDSLCPTAVIDGAWSQSLWGEDAASSLAVSTSLTVLSRMSARWCAATYRPSVCAELLAELDWLAHKASTDRSSKDEMLSGKMDCWSWNIDAADAKKAEGASI